MVNRRRILDAWKAAEDVLDRDDVLVAYDYKTDTVILRCKNEENPLTDEEKELVKSTFEQRLPGVNIKFKS